MSASATGDSLRICLVAHDFPPETARGGIGTQTWNKAHGLVRLGHTVHVISTSARPDAQPRVEQVDGITVHRLPRLLEGAPLYNPATYWLGHSFAVLARLLNLMETVPFDLIDAPDYAAEAFAYQLDRTPWNWVPVAVQLHGPLTMLAEHIGWPEVDSEFYRVGSFMERTTLRLADGLLACSANIADYVSATQGLRRDDIDVVHCGVDADAFHPAEPDRPARPGPTVLFVGNIADNKGVRVLLEAVLRLRAPHPGIRLVIAGGGGDELDRAMRARVDAEGAWTNVDFAGFVALADLPDLYRSADVFCMPATYETGVANVFLEAMATGLPVVGGEGGGTPEAVVPGETGVLVPPNDPPALADALDGLLRDPARRSRMGAAGRERVEAYFAMDRYLERVVHAYRRAIERAERARRALTAATGGG